VYGTFLTTGEVGELSSTDALNPSGCRSGIVSGDGTTVVVFFVSIVVSYGSG
jgi:hypothetical protein